MKKNKHIVGELLSGVGIGTVNGLLGGGGGMICVPLLNGVCGENTKVSHATTVLVILPVCIASAAVYWLSGKFDLVGEIPVIIGVVIGGAIGSVLLKVLKGRAISVIFALIMIAAGVRSLFL